MTVEARTVTLIPKDTRRLKRLGCRIAPEVIGSDVVRDEKIELQGMQLAVGGEVVIDYRIGNHPARVVFDVSNIQPPGSTIGPQTIVEILAEETQEKQLHGTDMRQFVRNNRIRRLELLEAEIAEWTAEGLKVDSLEAEANLLRSQLRIF